MALRRLTRAFRRTKSPSQLITQTHEIGDGTEEHHAHITKKLAKHELVGRHRQLGAEIEDIKKRLNDLRTVLQQLSDAYHSTKNDCPCFHCQDIQVMASEAVDAYQRLELEDGHKEEDETSKLLSPLQKLKVHARRLSSLDSAWKEQEIMYADLSEEDLESEVAVFEKTRDRLKREESKEVGRLETLRKALKDSRNYNIFGRYFMLKSHIRSATTDCLVD